jgi:hypothetical protein
MVKWMLVLVVISLIAINIAMGAAATICLGICYAIVWHLRVMLWHAEKRNETERSIFIKVNNGHAEPDPEFLVKVWNS